MMLSIDKYPDSLSNLKSFLLWADMAYTNTRITNLAHALIDGAIGFDLKKATELGLNWKYKGIVRDPANPPECEDSSIVGVDWADDPVQKMEPGESWNANRRATLSGAVYALDDQGRPINPYMNTGINGRGCLGQFGPNHAVDNGVIIIKPGKDGKQEACFALGITRKFDSDAPALAGGFAKYRKEEGVYTFDKEAAIKTRTEEFFEEMISGSVVLMPEFAHKFGERYEQTIQKILSKRPDGIISGDQCGEIIEQIITALKMEQVQKYDPGFLQRLEDHIHKGVECFAGPVLCDGRNTNAAWIESRLAWIMFNDDIWNEIKGENKFNYKLSGGDDASGVVYHDFTPALLQNAYASHGPMICFMAASFLLYAQESGMALAPSVLDQMEKVSAFLESYKVSPDPSVPVTPPPIVPLVVPPVVPPAAPPAGPTPGP